MGKERKNNHMNILLTITDRNQINEYTSGSLFVEYESDAIPNVGDKILINYDTYIVTHRIFNVNKSDEVILEGYLL